MVQEALTEFQRLNPGLSLNMYSDYKSLRAAIRGPTGQEDALMEQLDRLMDGVDQRFVPEVRAAGFVDEQFMSERWFEQALDAQRMPLRPHSPATVSMLKLLSAVMTCWLCRIVHSRMRFAAN